MAGALAKLGSCVVQAAVDRAQCSVESFWRDRTCVIAIFRRFGCKFCRLEAVNLSHLKPAFDKRNVRLIGISFDVDGLEEFQKGGFFQGDIFLDPEKQTYNALGFQRVSKLSGLKSIFSKAGRALNSVANAANISGNLSGDGWQTGGLLVVEKGGNILYQFTQEQLVNHPDYGKIMDVLQIPKEEAPKLNLETCSESACTRP